MKIGLWITCLVDLMRPRIGFATLNSCHDRSVVQKIFGLWGANQRGVATEIPDREVCCGFGGAFSVKLGDIATRMAENKCRSILATGVDAVVGGDLGCLLTIEGRLRREGHSLPVWHWAEVLAGTVT